MTIIVFEGNIFYIYNKYIKFTFWSTHFILWCFILQIIFMVSAIIEVVICARDIREMRNY